MSLPSSILAISGGVSTILSLGEKLLRTLLAPGMSRVGSHDDFIPVPVFFVCTILSNKLLMYLLSRPEG